LTTLSKCNLKFELSTPFSPYQQLLAVLPPASRKLLPLPYRKLMTSADSPINEYYPQQFELDLDGKRNDWEAKVLIPFIDEKTLISVC